MRRPIQVACNGDHLYTLCELAPTNTGLFAGDENQGIADSYSDIGPKLAEITP
jgi:hypothetical protein